MRLLGLLIAFPASGGDYYVSTAGTDAPNRGTAAQPWRTINYAIAGRSPGDTIHVAAGQTFNENVYFGAGGGAGGTAGNPVTLMCDDQVTVASGARLSAGCFQFTFRGIEGQPFRVLATNLHTAPLATWPTLTNGVFGVGGSATFTDPNATGQDTQRYYRVASP